MENSNARLLLLLSSMDLTSLELKEFARFLSELGPSEFAQRIVTLRRFARESDRSATSAGAPWSSKDPKGRRSLLARIEMMLTDEAELPKTTAAKMLTAELGNSLETKRLPTLGKL